jgi:hypothetical protein
LFGFLFEICRASRYAFTLLVGGAIGLLGGSQLQHFRLHASASEDVNAKNEVVENNRRGQRRSKSKDLFGEFAKDIPPHAMAILKYGAPGLLLFLSLLSPSHSVTNRWWR